MSCCCKRLSCSSAICEHAGLQRCRLDASRVSIGSIGIAAWNGVCALADDVQQVHLQTPARERIALMFTLVIAGVQCSRLGIPKLLAGPLLARAVALLHGSILPDWHSRAFAPLQLQVHRTAAASSCTWSDAAAEGRADCPSSGPHCTDVFSTAAAHFRSWLCFARPPGSAQCRLPCYITCVWHESKLGHRSKHWDCRVCMDGGQGGLERFRRGSCQLMWHALHVRMLLTRHVTFGMM